METLGYNGDMKSGIYQITNQLNGKRYVGSTTNLERRWRYHLGDLRRGQHSNRHLQAAFNKYGENTFAFSVLEYVETESLLEREQHYLDTRMPEYNILPTAGSPLGFQWTAEARATLSAAMSGERNPNYGKHPSDETLAKLSAARMGHSVSDKTRAKISNALRGRYISAETRRRISEARMGHRASAETRAKMSAALSGTGNPNYGKRHSMETRAKISAARKVYWRKVRALSERKGGDHESHRRP